VSPISLSALTKKTKIRGQEYYLKLVDTAGQDEYSIFPAQYTMDVDGFCLVYRYVLFSVSYYVSVSLIHVFIRFGSTA
jgi:GTPase SAR1 family protein